MKTAFRQFKALVKLSFLELWRRNDIFALVLLGLALMVPLSMASPFGVTALISQVPPTTTSLLRVLISNTSDTLEKISSSGSSPKYRSRYPLRQPSVVQ